MRNSLFVSVNCKTGEINRYEAGGERPRLTHEAITGAGLSIAPELIETLRLDPPDHLRVAPSNVVNIAAAAPERRA